MAEFGFWGDGTTNALTSGSVATKRSSVTKALRKSSTFQRAYTLLWGSPSWSRYDIAEFAEEGYRKNPYVYAAINALVNAASAGPPVLYRVTGQKHRGHSVIQKRAEKAKRSLRKAKGNTRKSEKALLRKAAETVVRQRASRYSCKLGCPHRIGKSMALKQLEVQGELEEVSAHPLLDVIERPNGYYQSSWAHFMKSYLMSLQISGTAFVEPVSPDGGENAGVPGELYVLPAEDFQMADEEPGDPIPGFYYGTGYGRLDFEYSPDPDETEIFYDRFPHPSDPRIGMSPMAAAFRSVQMTNAAHDLNKSIMDNGGIPPTIISADDGFRDTPGAGGPGGGLDQAEAEVQSHSFGSQWRRMIGEGKPIGLDGRVNVDNLGLDMKSLMWGDVIGMGALEVAIVYDVPPEIIGNTDARHYNSYESARKALYYEAGLPLADFAYDNFNAGWVRRFGDDLMLTYDADQIGALEEDVSSAYDRVENATHLSLNERRELCGYEAQDGLDIWLVDGNKVPLEAGDAATPQPAPAQSGDSQAVDPEQIEVTA